MPSACVQWFGTVFIFSFSFLVLFRGQMNLVKCLKASVRETFSTQRMRLLRNTIGKVNKRKARYTYAKHRIHVSQIFKYKTYNVLSCDFKEKNNYTAYYQFFFLNW